VVLGLGHCGSPVSRCQSLTNVNGTSRPCENASVSVVLRTAGL
jgi:hypothetical protein